MENFDNTHFIDKVAQALKKAAVEVEEFQLQAALGKAEAKDKYEEVKKKFNVFIHESRLNIQEGKDKVDQVNQKVDELRVQLALGKAETIDAFRIQKKRLLLALHELEHTIKSNETLKRAYAFILIEIETFKLQLDILEEEYGDSIGGAKRSFEKGKKEFNEFIDGIKKRYTNKDDEKWEHFQSELSQAFDHLKGAFTKP